MDRPQGVDDIYRSLGHLSRGITRFGEWLGRRSYWAVVLMAVLIVLLKSGFRWAGTTGEGWFVEFRDVIDAWPLQEPLNDTARAMWQEDYSSIVLFKGLHLIGLPYSSFTWMLLHWAATAGVVLLIAAWVKRSYGPSTGLPVLLLILFGSAPMVLLHEIGRYDALFFLGAVMIATTRAWWWVVVGIALVSTSSWTMTLGLAGGLVVTGVVLGSRRLISRGLGALAGSALAVVVLMALRAANGGDPSVGRLGAFTPGGSTNGMNPLYVAWWNLVQPFPNWIWAAFGVTWILFFVVVFQSRRRRLLLALGIVIVPVVAGAINASDGTRDIALALTGILLAVGAVLQRPLESVPDERSKTVGPALILGSVAVLCVAAPVVNIYPHEPTNPWGWLGLYGLSMLVQITS